MNIMQAEVNSLYDEYTTGTEEEKNTILNYGEVLDSDANKVFTTSTSGITDSSGYRYYTQATLKELDIDGVEGEFYVNVLKRSIISCEGLEYEGITYYTSQQLPNGVYNVEEGVTDSQGYFLKNSTIDGGEATPDNPTIPKGYRPINENKANWPQINTVPPSKDNVEEGLVIEDRYGNQFVWIPIRGDYVRNEQNTNSQRIPPGGGSSYHADIIYLPDKIQPIFDGNSANATIEYGDKSQQAERDFVTERGGFFVSRFEAGIEKDISKQKRCKCLEKYYKTGLHIRSK